MRTNLELSWMPDVKQWRKRRNINGKTKSFYLGTGNGKDDLLSYAKALAKWKEIEKKLDEADGKNKPQRIPEPKPGAVTFLVQCFPITGQSEPLYKNIKSFLDGKWLLNEGLATRFEPTPEQQKTLADCIDDYIFDQEKRFRNGQEFPDAPRRERLTGSRLISYRYNVKLIKTVWGKAPLPKDEATLASRMSEFRERQKSLMQAGKIQPGTLNERMKTMRHFVRWMHEQYLIPGLPRNMADLCAAYTVKSTAKSLDLDVIKRLWQNASPRFRTYMALALNCGFYAVDIATLERSHIKNGFIMCDRHKTGIPTRFKLWQVTRSLLEQHVATEGTLALLTEKGGPLMVIDPAANHGRGRRWCKIETDLAALKKRLKIEGVSFSMFRDTSSTNVEGIDRSLTDQFEGHKDKRMARFYVDGDKLDYDRAFAALDTVTDQLEGIYGLQI